jgi:putative SOS response-associated peptidase YedK
MCGRYTLTSAIDELLERLGLLGRVDDMGPRFNVAPSQMVPALRLSEEGTLQLELFRWGLIPSWAKDPSIGNRMINARGETVAEKPSFRAAFKKRRCLILSDGWYEWQQLPTRKQPIRIQLDSGAVFAFAGLWEHWEPKEGDREAYPSGEVIRSCAIITIDASPKIAHIHHRMPVVLKQESWDAWLGPEAPPDELQAMLVPYAGDDLATYPVSTLVNSPANDREDCILPLENPD